LAPRGDLGYLALSTTLWSDGVLECRSSGKKPIIPLLCKNKSLIGFESSIHFLFGFKINTPILRVASFRQSQLTPTPPIGRGFPELNKGIVKDV